ncbi:tyrosine-protein phosphatase [Brumimicrobium oceani]|uniref:protein-tyrosine-phosphatase n=1 Tax=Brumimicrobium oceani TaxID=2100725 RepID=A0A2U2XFQ9_9FLAO|nr:CpsB/CapC family capsule biosynthesis tyrosine phosphatase [Brumimicrobium oceani]PWH86636.1 capsular biosynthesis protein [Brumimicrobium oceani]
MGLIKSVFGAKPKTPLDLSALKVDMHSHLIPGIDDGSQSMDHTIGMLLRFVELGYRKVITTPHIMSDYYKNTPEIIHSGLEEVRAEVKRLNIPIEVDAAAEYFYDEEFLKLIENEKLLTFGDSELLFEFSFGAKPNNIDELIFKLKTKGYKPVLAHYERYLFFLDEGIEPARKLRENGVRIQMNLNSLTGHYGSAIKRQAEMLVDSELIDYLGTDCHRIEHLDILESNLTRKHFRKLNEMKFLNKNLI